MIRLSTVAALSRYCCDNVVVRSLLGSTWVYLWSTWVILGLLGSTWVILGILGSTWVNLGLLGSTWVYLGSTGVYLGLLG